MMADSYLGRPVTHRELVAAGYDPRHLRPGDVVEITIEPVRHDVGALVGRVAVLERRVRRLVDDLAEVSS